MRQPPDRGSLSRHFASRFLGVARRLPFTILLLLLLLSVAWYTDSAFARLPHIWLGRLGFAPRDLFLLSWGRLFTSALATHGHDVWWRALALTGAAVGGAEWLAGTWRTAATFWTVHLSTLILLAALVVGPLWFAGIWPDLAEQMPRDLGPSAGYFGCLGLLLRRSGRRGAQLALLVVGILLVVPFLPSFSATGTDSKWLADLAHLVAFPLGWWLGATKR